MSNTMIYYISGISGSPHYIVMRLREFGARPPTSYQDTLSIGNEYSCFCIHNAGLKKRPPPQVCNNDALYACIKLTDRTEKDCSILAGLKAFFVVCVCASACAFVVCVCAFILLPYWLGMFALLVKVV